MYVIKKYIHATENEFIFDVVETREILCYYVEQLMAVDVELKKIQEIPHHQEVGYTITILEKSGIEYAIEYYEFVSKPSRSSFV